MKHLKKILREQGKTQSDLAKALGRDKSAVTLLLQGKRQLKASEISLIADFLGIAETEVLGIEPVKSPPQEEVAPAVASPSPPAVPLIPIAGRVSERLAVSPYVLHEQGHYYYQGAPIPEAGCFMMEVADYSLELCGLLPNDLVLCDSNLQPMKNDIVLVKQKLNNGRDVGLLRKYQPPFLEYDSTKRGFERLHEERANVAIIAKVIEVIRHYS